MKPYILECCFLLLCMTTGCDSVTVTQPIGEVASIAELKKLQGAWINDDRENEEQEIMEVRISKAGDLTLGMMYWDEDSEQFRAVNMKLIATHSGTFSYLHMKMADETSKDGYSFFRYEHADEKTVRVYFPVPSRFQSAIESGTLDGNIKKTLLSVDIDLKTTSEAIQAFLAKTGVKECFEKEPSLTLTLVKRIE